VLGSHEPRSGKTSRDGAKDGRPIAMRMYDIDAMLAKRRRHLAHDPRVIGASTLYPHHWHTLAFKPGSEEAVVENNDKNRHAAFQQMP